ncbi:MAG: phenylalanine--tRNA ligase subunit beta, partial [Erysipelotrichaceae bacterium]|nr:phenylalanine--tRNA ligase subunit beta [Erysipelotrichaceae bacterium]
MKVSYNWISKYVDLSGISPEYLADKLTFAGLEVEQVTKMADGSDLVVGHILSCDDHPDSDHLHVCMVDIDTEILQIVCGADNVAKDQKVIVAQVGSKLPELTIKEGNIRGVRSQGMICALFELGVDRKLLSQDQLQGITVLPNEALVGDTNPLSYIGMDDVIIDISLTPNRADCMALWSLAKEIGAILDRNVNLPKIDDLKINEKQSNLLIKSNSDKCQSFVGKVINSLVIKESPSWLKDALTSIGIKSINNVVDISNFVMIETGQPLHFYDIDKMPKKEIVVKDDIDMVYRALDQIDYQIIANDIMITSDEKPIGIAGIMGGEDSKIDENTKGIIIEAAIFDLAAIRSTSRRLNLSTEASIRFQKGIDPLAPMKAVNRAVQLLIDLAEADAIEESVLINDFNYQQYQIETSTTFINTYLATSFSDKQIVDVLSRLDLNPHIEDDKLIVYVPSYRTDLRLPVDLCEEVIRLLGYDNVLSSLPKIYQVAGEYAKNARQRYMIKDLLKDMGFSETINYSLVNQKHIDNSVLAIGKPVALNNPLSEDKRFYRTSVLASLLETIAYNKSRYLNEYMFFEIANVYSDEHTEKEHLALAMSKKTTINKWKHLVNENDFYTLKGYITKIIEKLGFDQKRISFKSNDLDQRMFNQYQSALIYLDKTLVGVFGMIHPKKQKEWGIDQTLIAEIDVTTLFQAKTSKIKFQSIPRFPAVSYDIAVIVDDKYQANDMCLSIKKTGGKLIKNVIVFDVYKGGNINDGLRSLAFKITYQSLDKTLNDNDIQPIQKEIISMLNKQYGAILRDI